MINLKTNEWEIKNIDTVLFDKDGTLVDLHYFWGKMTEFRIDEILKKCNLDIKHHKELCSFLGFDTNCQKMLPDGITALYSRPKIIELLIEELKKYNVKITSQEVENIFDEVSENFYKNIEKYIKPIDEAIDFAKKLKEKGVKLGIVTADSIISTNKTLKFLNVSELFDIVIARESYPERKETGKPTIYALEQLNSNPEKTIMIGDTPIDCTSAKNAEIQKTILVATGQLTKKDLTEISKYSCDTLSEIEISLQNVKLC